MAKPSVNTLQALLANSVTTYGDKIAYTYGDEQQVSYNQLGQQAAELRYYLATHGISRHDKVALISENMPNWCIAYYALGSMGVVIVPVLVDFSAAEMNTVLRHAEVKALIVSDKVLNKLEKDAVVLPELTLSIHSFTNLKTGESIHDVWQAAGEQAKAWEPETVEPDDLACIIYTSGTTGRSKGVMLTHNNLIWDADTCRTLYPVADDDVSISVLPLAHTYECTLGLILGTMNGSTTHYIDKAPTANVLMPLFRKHRPTMMLTVPLIIEKIFRAGVKSKFTKSPVMRFLYGIRPIQYLLHKVAGKKLKRVFGGHLRFFGIGGAAVSPEVERFLRDAKFPYSCGYGLTETSPMLCGLPVDKTKYRSVGPPMVGIEYKLVDVNPHTGEGELVVNGPNVMKGYYKDPESTASVLSPDGWFRTGDLAVVDKKNNVTLKGRSKNMILGASGENIYPEEIEAVINEMDSVVESVVYQNKGRLVASVYLNAEEFAKKYHDLISSAHNYQEELKKRMDAYLKELKIKVNQMVSRHSQLNDVELRQEPFEKTATMKIKRFMINKDKNQDADRQADVKA